MVNIYPIFCEKCGKILGVTVGLYARVQCPECGQFVVAKMFNGSWQTKTEAK